MNATGAVVSTGGTSIIGIGIVCGIEVMISSNRYTVKGGTIDEATLKRVKTRLLADWYNGLESFLSRADTLDRKSVV